MRSAPKPEFVPVTMWSPPMGYQTRAQPSTLAGAKPELALVVDVTTAYFHCAKCIIRSKLWSQEQEATTCGCPKLGRGR